MSARIYTTTAGEAWDQIAQAVYGDTARMTDLLRENPTLRTVVLFSAGVQVVCPEVTVPVSSALPPWKRE
ncbi:MAG TPA: tail protein X [Armatimonadota bacterium]|jgi:phage tail protein X